MSRSLTRARSVKKRKTARTRPEWTQRVRSRRACRALVSERSVQMLPVGLPFQGIILTAQLHINPETSLERLIPLVEI